MSGTPYVVGGDTPSGTDCSGLVSWVANTATGRPTFGDRFHTANEEAALLERGFQYGTAPDALVIGWNSGHTAATLPDGTPVSAGESGGVQIGGEGAYQPQFTNHMFLPMPPEQAGPGLLDVPPPMPPPPPEGEVQAVGFVFDDAPPPPAPLAPGFAPPPPPPEDGAQAVGFVFDDAAPPPAPPAPPGLPFFPPPPGNDDEPIES